jgi:starvation-inducible DNA-binding protein
MKKMVTVGIWCLLLNISMLRCPASPVSLLLEPMSIGIDAQARNEIATALNQLLSDEYVLYVKTQKYHWNVTGPWFGQLHGLFNNQYEDLSNHIDSIAERVRALGAKAYGTLTEFSQQSNLKEEQGVNPEALVMIKNLLSDHEVVIRSLQNMINYVSERKDVGTVNFLEELITKHQKMAWMLRAHLQG